MTNRRSLLVALQIFVLLSLVSVAWAADWPMWRCDPGRTASSPEELPGELHLQWVREYAPRDTAWDDPLNDDLMPYDRVFEPVVLGDTLFLGFNDSDKVVALDTATGEERWRFYTDGPVRLPAVCDDGKVLFACDDGYLYCLDSATGELRWKFRGGPSERKLLGNQRLISTWPARGGPVLQDGIVYFAASIWPFMGTFIYALDADTGEIVWRNDRMSAQWIKQPHDNPAFAGVAPQGAFAIAEGKLIVPGGRSVPCAFDLMTGDYLYYQLSEYDKTGGAFVCAANGVFFNHHRDQIATMYSLETGLVIAPQVGRYPAVADGVLYTSGDAIIAAEIEKVRKAPKAWKEQALWQLEMDAGGDLIKAGSRLYAGGKGHITALQLAANHALPSQAWTQEVDGDVGRLVAANGRLFAVTLAGRILAYGAEAVSAPRVEKKVTESQAEPNALQTARAILDASETREGYALFHGAGDGNLLQAIAQESELTVIAFDAAREKVDALRPRFDAAGLYGKPVAVHEGTPLTVPLPAYLASLTIVNDLDGAGFEATEQYVRRLFHSMRPYGGKTWLALTGSAQSDFIALVESLQLPGATVGPAAGGILLTREGPLPGAAPWTHQYGDAANTVKSDDSLVKMPLGLLWFGGSSNMDVLPRHGHGPPEQIIGGRLFIEGMDVISARDVYTGRVLWKTPLGDLGTFNVYYDKTYKNTPTSTAYNQVHIPGANIRGTNFVATLDKVYILQGPDCHVLDAVTGEKLTTFTAPKARGDEEQEWGYIGVYEDTLVLGCAFVPFSAIPAKGEMDAKEKKAYREFWKYDKSASRHLIAMDRHTGETRWTLTARHGFLHNGVAIGNNALFCLDKRPPYVENFFRRRGRGVLGTYRLAAVDLDTGRVNWKTEEDIFGSWLGYSKEHDVLLQATRPSSDTVAGETGSRMIVYRVTDGEVLWNVSRGYNNPPMLHGDKIITHSKMYSLLTGEPVERRNPLTSNPMPWSYERTKGCNYHVACENIITFRSSAASYYDLATDGGTGHFGGFKSGCTSNLIAADGVLNAPDYTRTCSCAYQNQTSLAFVHDPDVEVWTTFPKLEVDGPIQRLGINLGAPGDRRAEDGTLWLEYPVVAGTSPDVGIQVGPDLPGAVNRGVTWKYLDDGSDQGTAWREADFDDSAWKEGPAELGYGDGDEATTVEFGPDAENKHITTYFRHAFEAEEAPAFDEFLLNVKHDDGVIVYLNGQEVLRAAMPQGDVHFQTPSTGGDGWSSGPVEASLVGQGTNVLAVGIHQRDAGSSDISFDLELTPVVQGADWILHHTSFMEGDGPNWVGASAGDDLTGLRMNLLPPGASPQLYTVRLYFAELQAAAAGERIFDVSLQGKGVLPGFDIAKAAGGPRRTVVREFSGIEVADVLEVTLSPSKGAVVSKPLLSGVEVIAEGR